MERLENNNELNNLIDILDNETKALARADFNVYEDFKREYTIFIKLLYDRLKACEADCLDSCRVYLGDSVFSFGTDEFVCEYKEFAETLASIDEALGRDYNPSKYSNPLVMFRNMYNNFFYLIGGNSNARESLDKFAELTKSCLGRIGFDQVKTNYFLGALIFEIDNCSRIAKGMEALYAEQRRYREENPGTLIVTDEYTIQTYVGNYLKNWFQNNGNNLNNDTSSMTLK